MVHLHRRCTCPEEVLSVASREALRELMATCVSFDCDDTHCTQYSHCVLLERSCCVAHVRQ
jgi:hypothetical protein